MIRLRFHIPDYHGNRNRPLALQMLRGLKRLLFFGMSKKSHCCIHFFSALDFDLPLPKHRRMWSKCESTRNYLSGHCLVYCNIFCGTAFDYSLLGWIGDITVSSRRSILHKSWLWLWTSMNGPTFFPGSFGVFELDRLSHDPSLMPSGRRIAAEIRDYISAGNHQAHRSRCSKGGGSFGLLVGHGPMSTLSTDGERENGRRITSAPRERWP